MTTRTDRITLAKLEQTVIERLKKETEAPVIDTAVIDSLTKALDVISHHLNRRDDDLFRASGF